MNAIRESINAQMKANQWMKKQALSWCTALRFALQLSEDEVKIASDNRCRCTVDEYHITFEHRFVDDAWVHVPIIARPGCEKEWDAIGGGTSLILLPPADEQFRIKQLLTAHVSR